MPAFSSPIIPCSGVFLHIFTVTTCSLYWLLKFVLLAPSILALTVYQLPVNPNQNSYKGFFRRRRAPSCCPCLPKSASDVTDRKTDWQCATACWCYIWIQRNYTINSCCVYFIRCLPNSRQEMTYLAKANVRQLLVELCKQLEFSLHSQSSPNNSNTPVVSGTGRSACSYQPARET